MNTTHYAHWPPGLPYSISTPETSIYVNLEISARRFPDKAAIVFYDAILSYAQLRAEVDVLAGYLQAVCGVHRGDRVLLDMQNCPQFVIAYYAILRADAVVVPVNPMLMTIELSHYIEDSGAKVAIAAQDTFAKLAPLMGITCLAHAVVATYSDYLTAATDLAVPELLRARREVPDMRRVIGWQEAIGSGHAPRPHLAEPDDFACMPYTSGTTGKPKGCIHTHRSVMFTAVGSPNWSGALASGHVSLAVLPFYHVTGMQISMNALIYSGGTIVILPRWDRELAAQQIVRYKVTHWANIATMMIDFLSNPRLGDYDLTSLRRVSGGGAVMPAPIAQKLLDLTGLQYMEGYGLSETMAPSHINPPQRMKQQCLGIPVFNTDARIIDPVSMTSLAPHEVGEIVIHGPQLFRGYWKDPEKTAQAFCELDGKDFFRSGDLGYMDEEGFFFYTDRLKRMINTSGFKIWPAEVEMMLHQHPAIEECCVIAASDVYRGEIVKALVVRKRYSTVSADDIIGWAREKMAADKVPRAIEFVDTLPKSPTGKVLWRVLQDKEKNKPAE